MSPDILGVVPYVAGGFLCACGVSGACVVYVCTISWLCVVLDGEDCMFGLPPGRHHRLDLAIRSGRGIPWNLHR